MSAAETKDWHYPMYVGHPYTSAFANKVIDLNIAEDRFWRYVKYVKTHGGGQVYFDLYPAGQLSLPKWSFTAKGQKFGDNGAPQTLQFELGKEAKLQGVSFGKDYDSRLSQFGSLVQHLVPYLQQIEIVTPQDSVVLPFA